MNGNRKLITAHCYSMETL